MPEPAVAEPVAPAAPAAPAAPTPELHITPAVVDLGPKAEAPAKGSARESFFKEFRKKVGAEPAEPKQIVKQAAEEIEKSVAEPEPEPKEPEKTGAEPAKSETIEKPPAKKGKVNPWALVDDLKSARAKLEQELSEVRKLVPDPAQAKEREETFTKSQARLKELEDEIRFVNYTKSQDYLDKYQKPYDEAWHRWMNDLRELTVDDPQKGQRAIEPDDVLELVNMPLAKARQRAEQVFGDFADDVMSARKEIRNLFDAQQKALNEAREKGAERDAQMAKEQKDRQEKLVTGIQTLWNNHKNAILADEKFGSYFKPVEGDEEGNKRLNSGFELADRAFSVNPADPNLTDQEREEVVKLHVAIRNRAAAFGRLVYLNHQVTAERDALKAELAKYKGIQPGAGEGARTPAPARAASAREQVFSALRQRAH